MPLSRALRRMLRNKRLIFTVTTGRSGTAYLAAVFRYAKNIQAFHEPEPQFYRVLRAAQTRPEIARRFLLEEKFPAIAGTSGDVYIETSHLACKGFLEPMLDLDIVPDLLIHRRPFREVSLSLFRMGTVPGRNEKALQFYLSPDDPDVMPLKGWQRLHDYQLCYWYCLEMERRARRYGELFEHRNARVVETTLEGLKTVKGLRQMLSAFDLTLRFPQWLTVMRFKRNSRFKVNEAVMKKKPVDIPDRLPEMERAVIQGLEAPAHHSWLLKVEESLAREIDAAAQ